MYVVRLELVFEGVYISFASDVFFQDLLTFFRPGPESSPSPSPPPPPNPTTTPNPTFATGLDRSQLVHPTTASSSTPPGIKAKVSSNAYPPPTRLFPETSPHKARHANL